MIKNEIYYAKRYSLLRIYTLPRTVGNLICYLRRYKADAKKLNHAYVMNYNSLVNNFTMFCKSKQYLEEYVMENIPNDYDFFMGKFHKMCELFYLSGLHFRNEKKSTKLYLEADSIFNELHNLLESQINE